MKKSLSAIVLTMTRTGRLPIMEPDGMITSVWHSGVIFCPREGEVALMMITRRFDSAALLRQKRDSASAVPLGTPLI